ncbi:MAG: ABC transporter permease [Alphaproteobacteria bacterium]|nr:ABC transporter permease [Alphaproteobacteria bacterium]
MIGRGILLVVIGPILIGLIGAVLPALGYFPPLGGDHFSLAPMQDFLALPQLWRSIGLSLFTGLVATVISTIIALILPGLLYGRKSFHLLRRYLAPILSLPHVTVAVGIFFLLQPSGWLMRIISPGLTGYTLPPIWALVPDPWGMGLVLGLVAKEVPFLILMTLAAMSQINTAPLLTVSRSLGYGPLASWIYVIIPQLWPRLRLPVMIVLVFSLSVVDMAVILAPTTPPPLAVRLITLYQDPDLTVRFTASVAAMAQVVLVLVSIAVMMAGARVLAWLGRMAAVSGYRSSPPRALARFIIDPALVVTSVVPCLAAVAGLLAAMLWSIAGVWRFPSAWPSAFTLRFWSGVVDGFGDAVLVTAGLGFASAALAVVLVVMWLNAEDHRPKSSSEHLLVLPLMIPQVGFLFGLQIMLLWLRLDGTTMALVYAHLLFVLPYVWLSLAPAWREFRPEWLHLGASLGASPLKRFFRIRLPILIMPILTSFAVGFSVSAALYLPTVFAGNGRVTTLTVEAVTLASGASRAQLGVATGLQMALPLVVFVMAGILARQRPARISYFS